MLALMEHLVLIQLSERWHRSSWVSLDLDVLLLTLDWASVRDTCHKVLVLRLIRDHILWMALHVLLLRGRLLLNTCTNEVHILGGCAWSFNIILMDHLSSLWIITLISTSDAYLSLLVLLAIISNHILWRSILDIVLIRASSLRLLLNHLILMVNRYLILVVLLVHFRMLNTWGS
jgi:hypothetical protein